MSLHEHDRPDDPEGSGSVTPRDDHAAIHIHPRPQRRGVSIFGGAPPVTGWTPGRYLTEGSPAVSWLTRNESEPARAHERWALGQSAAITVGRTFDLIVLPSQLIEATIKAPRDGWAIEGTFRRAGITCGVVVSRRQDTYQVLVRPGTARKWSADEATAIGADAHQPFLHAPPPGRRSGPGAFWLLLCPEASDQLASADMVLALLRGDAR
ncbi:hypothetical protein AB0K09_05870 [Streptomyces sp. NPDC049577]|uniref:hypothetical protein n=1 Tax=Streptomyces sp. NPDC049577 TaxID=3155153 RepID=UPI0034391078